MRAQNQQDLIYKRGQAGITKASVTIVFDNSDREKSPVGLENCKQITVTRQARALHHSLLNRSTNHCIQIALPNISKYLLNGHKSTQQNVQTLFQSVQLNINNPNFLIMQGRITKVLNMRPQEILGMVEEASGTRMFEERKDKAKKTMGKKEKRVEQITALLNEEITPKLDSLRAKKKSYLQYQKSCSELEKMVRIISAWDWVESTKLAERKAGEMTAKEDEKSKVEKTKERHAQERDAAEEEREAVTAQRERELKKGGKAKKLEESVTKIDMELVKLKTQIELKENSVAGEAKRVSEQEKEIKGVSFSVSYPRRFDPHPPSSAKTWTRNATRLNAKRRSSIWSKMSTTNSNRHYPSPRNFSKHSSRVLPRHPPGTLGGDILAR
jgi:structural maintenance of chromosome 2